jgi:hypothetical protein
MASRTQIVCLHEGEKGRSIDPVFINTLLKALAPGWIRQWKGSNVVRPIDCGGRSFLIERMPVELRACLAMGSDTTLMVWADLDHDMPDGEALKERFWKTAQGQGITRDQFDQVVFVFAKDRLENWIEFLRTGTTDEGKEGPRVKLNKQQFPVNAKLLKSKVAFLQILLRKIQNLNKSVGWESFAGNCC